MPIAAICRGDLGRHYMGQRPGSLFALLPDPVDADACLASAGFTRFADSDERWDADFDAFVAATVTALQARFGEPEVTVPERSPHAAWVERLDGFLGGLLLGRSRPARRRWTATDALRHAARDDQTFAFAHVGFGDANHRHAIGYRAGLFAGDGHPILWVWLDEQVAEQWPAIAQAAAGDWPCTELELAWGSLLPSMPMLARELPRASLHRGDAASWTDGARTLWFHAGLGVSPPEVYLPPESQWPAHAPAWAASLRPTIVRELEAIGVRVVETPRGAVIER
jgi:hypothetical protein